MTCNDTPGAAPEDSVPEEREPEDRAPEDAARSAVMRLLAQHVPLSLIADVCIPDGPCSHEILEAERGTTDESWTR